jgi:hypothetical protein
VVNGVAYAAVQPTAPAPVAAARTPYAMAQAPVAVGQVPYAAPRTVPATQLAAAPRPAAGTCDGLLSNGCYLAKRRFSTPRGMELRCTIICE